MGCGYSNIKEKRADDLDVLILRKNNIVSSFLNNNKVPDILIINNINNLDLEINQRLNNLKKKKIIPSTIKRKYGGEFLKQIKNEIKVLNIKWKEIIKKYMNEQIIKSNKSKQKKDNSSNVNNNDSNKNSNSNVQKLELLHLGQNNLDTSHSIMDNDNDNDSSSDNKVDIIGYNIFGNENNGNNYRYCSSASSNNNDCSNYPNLLDLISYNLDSNKKDYIDISNDNEIDENYYLNNIESTNYKNDNDDNNALPNKVNCFLEIKELNENEENEDNEKKYNSLKDLTDNVGFKNDKENINSNIKTPNNNDDTFTLKSIKEQSSIKEIKQINN